MVVLLLLLLQDLLDVLVLLIELYRVPGLRNRRRSKADTSRKEVDFCCCCCVEV